MFPRMVEAGIWLDQMGQGTHTRAFLTDAFEFHTMTCKVRCLSTLWLA